MYFKIEIAGPAGGALTKIEDGYGRNMNVSYDGFGRVTSVGNSAGRSASFAYTDGRLTAVTDIDGSQTTYSYDGQGRLARRKQQVNTLPPAIYQGHRIAGIYILTKGTQRGIIIMNEAI